MKTAEEHLSTKSGDLDSESRKEFEAKVKTYYYSSLREREWQRGTHVELAEQVGEIESI